MSRKLMSKNSADNLIYLLHRYGKRVHSITMLLESWLAVGLIYKAGKAMLGQTMYDFCNISLTDVPVTKIRMFSYLSWERGLVIILREKFIVILKTREKFLGKPFNFGKREMTLLCKWPLSYMLKQMAL